MTIEEFKNALKYFERNGILQAGYRNEKNPSWRHSNYNPCDAPFLLDLDLAGIELGEQLSLTDEQRKQTRNL